MAKYTQEAVKILGKRERMRDNAPEMYEALKSMIKWFGNYPVFIPKSDMPYELDIEKAKAVLASIDGGK